MEEKLYTVKLADGTTFKDLKLNGNNFISKSKIEATIFDANCSPVTISCDGKDDVHDNMALVHVTPMMGEYWFTLRDMTSEELNQIKLRSDVDYIAMMAEVEL